MSQPLVFGWEAPEFVMPLYRGSDYNFELVADPPWPDGFSIEFRFSATPLNEIGIITWTATIDNDKAIWDVTATEVDEVLDADADYITLAYSIDPNRTKVWMKGTVRAS